MNATRTIIITGGSSGLGLNTVREVAADPQNFVIIASRKPQDAADVVNAEIGHDNVISMKLDLGSLADVDRFVIEFRAAALPPLYGIVCNAGVTLAGKTRYSAEGHELTFAVNHLGHFRLINALMSDLMRPGRIVLLSSGTHIPEHKLARLMQVPSPNYTSAKSLALGDNAPQDERLTNQSRRYSTSKLCNVLFGYELARQLDDADVGVFMLDPGLMPDTNLANEYPAVLAKVMMGVVKLFVNLTPLIRLSSTSAKDVKRLLFDPKLAGRTGLYFDGSEETKSSTDSYDLAKAQDLWQTSVALM